MTTSNVTTGDTTMEEPQEPQFTKEEICKFSHEQLLEHHKQFAKILAKFAKGKVPTKDDWAKSVKPFSVWKMEWDMLSRVWDPEQMDFVTRKDLQGDE